MNNNNATADYYIVEDDQFQRHTLSLSYNLELGDEVEPLRSCPSKGYQPTPTAGKWKFVVLCGGFFVVVSSWWGMISSESRKQSIGVPLPDLERTCGSRKVETLSGALACEADCKTASCCHDTCWEKNKAACLKYHHTCMMLDGIEFSTGEPHQLLPGQYKGGWFHHHDKETVAHPHDSASKPKKHLPSISAFSHKPKFPPLNDHEARERACREGHASQRHFRDCVRLCIPASCCYDGSHSSPTECHTAKGQKVNCEEYRSCDVLY